MRPAALLTLFTCLAHAAEPLESRIENGYATNQGVKIHFAALGPKNGPLVVFVHGFPDFWYTWRSQMEALSTAGYRTVALDLRGYNLSDKPTGAENYDMRLLVADVVAVIRAQSRERAIVVGHDWGGAISWQVAFHFPQAVEKLVILNLPHPQGLGRELATNADQQKASEYARDFQKPGSHTKLTPEGLAFWVKDAEAKPKYVEAFRRSSLDGMMNYYRRNYPREPYQMPDPAAQLRPQCPVLMIHGLKDTALLSAALNGTWNWVDDLTLVTVPLAGHFVQQDAADVVNRSLLMWLKR